MSCAYLVHCHHGTDWKRSLLFQVGHTDSAARSQNATGIGMHTYCLTGDTGQYDPEDSESPSSFLLILPVASSAHLPERPSR